MANKLLQTLTVNGTTYDSPTKTSQLTNDSGFVTDVPVEVAIQNGQPTSSALWIDTDATDEITLAEIDDNSVSTESTWSSSKIKSVTDELSEEIVEYEKNPLWGKKASFLGDSICAGSDAEGRYLGGYGKIIAERNNMVYENLAQGGATVTAGTISLSTGQNRTWLCRKVAEMSEDSDYAIIEGGINDAWYTGDGRELTIGSITTGYNATLDDTTYYGAFESMLKQLVTKFKGKKIGYIAVPKIMNMYDSEQNVPNFYHIALECCAKWGVPVCDLNTIVTPTTYLTTLGTDYTTDGTHPTYEGYIKYYCDPIEAWMKTLTTGGNNTASMVRKSIEEYTKGFNDAIKALQDGKLDNTGITFKKAILTLADGSLLEIDVLTALNGTVVIPYINQVPISIDTDKSVFNGTGYKEGYRLSSSGVVKESNGVVVTGYIPVKGGDVVRIYGCEFATTLNALSYICAYDSSFTFIGAKSSVAGSSLSFTNYGTNIMGSYSADENYNFTVTLANVSNIAYIRVCSKGHIAGNYASFDPKDMIVTVNEEITD